MTVHHMIMVLQVQEEPEGVVRRPPHQLHPDLVEHLQTFDQVRMRRSPV